VSGWQQDKIEGVANPVICSISADKSESAGAFCCCCGGGSDGSVEVGEGVEEEGVDSLASVVAVAILVINGGRDGGEDGGEDGDGGGGGDGDG
jgi:hypothetical protein